MGEWAVRKGRVSPSYTLSFYFGPPPGAAGNGYILAPWNAPIPRCQHTDAVMEHYSLLCNLLHHRAAKCLELGPLKEPDGQNKRRNTPVSTFRTLRLDALPKLEGRTNIA
jgi:hypothetical protein